jgi:hypothetical protein
MGTPLSPAIADFFMEDFEKKALSTAPRRPKCFFRYVDDSFLVWPHGTAALQEFLKHMNSQHPSITFTMEVEEHGQLPFLDILIRRKEDGSLGHTVYRKPTHTDLYLNGQSHHHPSQKAAVLSTLVHRAKLISDNTSISAELDHLKHTFLRNGYGKPEIFKALRRSSTKQKSCPDEPPEKPLSRALIPYVSTISGKIHRILRRYNIETVHLPPPKLRHRLVRAKDPIGLKTPGVYEIPCECGKVYVGETGRTIETRLKEHRRHFRLAQPEKSAVAEKSINEDHAIGWGDTKI